MRKLLLIFFLIPNLAYSLPETLDEYISQHPTWNSSDMALLSYITSRCSVLSLVISERYKNQNDAQSKKLYKLTSSRATLFAIYSDAAFKEIGGTTKSFQERAKVWAKLYGEEGVSNTNVYGTFIRGDIASDLTTCGEQVLPLFE